MTEIVLVRHGETEWNVKEVFRGRIDIELNEIGVRQAELLAEYLSRRQIDTVYSSPLQRALRTAERIARDHQLDVKIRPGLIDLDYGEWQGLSHQEVKEQYGELYVRWRESPEGVRMPSGESLGDVSRRAAAVVKEVTEGCRGTAVLVSHRVVNKVLICALLGLDNAHFWNIRQDTCGMTTFSYQNQHFILTEHNNTSYLKPIEKAPSSDF